MSYPLGQTLKEGNVKVTWVVGILLTLVLAFGGIIWGDTSKKIEKHEDRLLLLEQSFARIETKLDFIIEQHKILVESRKLSR